MGDVAAMIGVLLAGLALVALGGVLLLGPLQLRRRLRRMPRSRALDVRPGEFVKLVGRLTARAPMLAPLANVDCVYYRLDVLERPGSDDRWVEVRSERMYAESWMLQDESGRIDVQPEEGALEYVRLREYDPKTALPSDDVRQDVVMRYVPRHEGQRERPFRLREERLDQGASVILFGRVVEGPRGLMLAGGDELELYGETEQQLTAPRPADLFSWALVFGGVVLLGWSLVTLGFKPEPEGIAAVPIERSVLATPPPVPLQLKKPRAEPETRPVLPTSEPYPRNRYKRY